MKLSEISEQLKILLIVIAVLVIAGAVFWLRKRKAQEPAKLVPVSVKQPEQGGLGTEVFNKTKNPLKGELPKTNPFQVKSNPFAKQKNPLDAIYKNPFK